VQIEPVFIAKWNAQHAPATSAIEKTQALLDYKLRPEDVGTMVSDMGRTQHAHIAWAEGILEKAHECGLENRVEYIYQVVAGLPGSVRNCLDESYMDWTTFIGKVKAINVSQLKVQANMEKSIWELNALVQNLNINRRTESQMVSPRPQQYRPVLQAVVTTPNRSNGTTPSNQFRANPYTTSPVRAFQPRAPTTETEKAEIQQRLLTYPHQVNTDASQAVYQ
jgi:hypothetical protein